MVNITDLKFDKFIFNSRKQILTGVDDSGKYFIKVQVIKNKNKRNSIFREYEIIKYLNEKGCKSCPTAYDYGWVKKDELYSKVDQPEILDNINSKFEYIIQDYIPSDDNGHLSDMIFSIIEQKKLGVYQADIKPANIRFDSKNSTCYIIDYDQAMMLNDYQTEMDNLEFFNFCSHCDKKKYGVGDWLRHFPQYTMADVMGLMKDSALDLSKTTIFNTQITTNTPNGIYHTIQEKDIFIDGARTLSDRSKLLDSLQFDDGERVLDIGCNSGLLSLYLHGRHCNVTGVDCDPHIVIASKMVSNILGKDIEYYHQDLDFTDELDKFDTIMLFSVLHHTRAPLKNAEKITKACSRIILECRLKEAGGKQPPNGEWEVSNNFQWDFNTIESLVLFCETMFGGFKLKTNLGIADKQRYILEFIKE